MNNDFYRHQRSDKVKWVFTGIAFLLVFAMIVGLCLQLFGTGKQKPSEWFKKDETEQTTPDKGESETASGGMTITNEYVKESGLQLMSAPIATADYEENGISPQADSAYTITATVAPTSAEIKAVKWSIAWGTTNTEWSNGKSMSSYLTLSSPVANPVTLTCRKAFCAQAIITCTSSSDSKVIATCTVDYKTKVRTMNPYFRVGSTEQYYLAKAPTLPIFDSGEFRAHVLFDEGSVSDTFTISTTVAFSDESIAWLESNYPNWGSGYGVEVDLLDRQSFSLANLFYPDSSNFLFVPSVEGSLWGTSNAETAFYQEILPAFNSQTFAKLKWTETVTDSSGNVITNVFKTGLENIPTV